MSLDEDIGVNASLMSGTEQEKILEQLTRRKIYGYILANPGDHYNSIKKTLELSSGTFSYHIHILIKEGIIKSVREGTYRCFYPSLDKEDLAVVI